MSLGFLIALLLAMLGCNVVPRVRRDARNRRKRPIFGTTGIFTADFTTPNIALTFNVPVTLSGIPQLLTDTGKLPVSASQTSATVITLVYDTPGSVTEVTMPERDPAIRTASGGYASAGTFPAA